MITIEYLIYDDEPLRINGKYAGVAPAYGSVIHHDSTPYDNTVDPRPSECTWIVPGTMTVLDCASNRYPCADLSIGDGKAHY